MTRESILVLLGLLVIAAPFVGLPLHILSWVLPVLGVLIAALAYTLRIRRRAERTRTPAVVPEPPAFS